MGFWHSAMSRPVVFTALKVAAVVGTILNVINQGEVLWAGVEPDLPRLLLNYLTPYCVASYSGAKTQAAAYRLGKGGVSQ
ncbi:nitrate/nitrite transporter NrtS [uncultured Spongiibacter sp.]|uniref:nitrate/nitrite transporter NrtS n=1 Tax=uncultured Spongiibacter sp. TaxID=870896 RepID=UPI00258AF1FD|nr:nitrate/nitrite transporter NrtS [uncultured Spongiibacter sp.]